MRSPSEQSLRGTGAYSSHHVTVNDIPYAIMPALPLLVDSCRDIHDPRALAQIFAKAEADLADRKHPDPYRRKCPSHRNFDCVQTRGHSSSRGSRWHQVVCLSLIIQYCSELKEPSGSATCRYVRKDCFAQTLRLTPSIQPPVGPLFEHEPFNEAHGREGH